MGSLRGIRALQSPKYSCGVDNKMIATIAILVLIAWHGSLAETGCEDCDIGMYSFGRSCYYFDINPVIFSTAKSDCEARGLHLVYVGSAEEQTFLAATGKAVDEDSSYWLGLSKTDSGIIVWMDQEEVTYSNWGSNAFNENKDCFRMQSNSNYRWNDRSCSYLFGYICEGEAACLTTTATDPVSTRLDQSITTTAMTITDATTSACSTAADLTTFVSTLRDQSTPSRAPTTSYATTLSEQSSTSILTTTSHATTLPDQGTANRVTTTSHTTTLPDQGTTSRVTTTSHATTLSGQGTPSRVTTTSYATTLPNQGTPSRVTTTSYATTLPDHNPTGAMSSATGSPRSAYFHAMSMNTIFSDSCIIGTHTSDSIIRCAGLCNQNWECTHFTFVETTSTCILGNAADLRVSDLNQLYGAKTFRAVVK